MGFKGIYLCPACNYSVLISGGADRGMFCFTDTFVCLDCKELQDLVVDRADRILIKRPDAPSLVPTKASFKCQECDSTNVELWDNKKQPCPKCGGKMQGGIPCMIWD